MQRTPEPERREPDARAPARAAAEAPLRVRFRAVLFDLDGTLLDTLRDLAESMNAVLRARGFPTHPVDAYRHYVGEGARMLVTRALPAHARDAASIETALEDYRLAYGARWDVHTRPYDGIPDMLDALTARGLILGILSNKPHPMTLKCADRYLARWPFACVLGQRAEVARKPDPAGAREAAALMRVAHAEILYLGDTATDIETARAAGMCAVGATWGFRPESELREAGAHAIVHHPREVPALLEARAPHGA